MTFWQWLQENWVKTLSSIGALNSALITATASGMFVGLMPETSIKWLALVGFFMNAWLIGVGVNNTTKEKIAAAMDTAIKATPPRQTGFIRVSLLLALMAVVALIGLTACATPPHKVIEVACTPGTTYSVERCVKGIAETWEVYQVRAELVTADPLTPADVKEAVQKAEAASRPVVVDTLHAGAFYAQVKQQLAAGETTAEQLAIANAKLEEWVAKALPLVRSFGDKLGR